MKHWVIKGTEKKNKFKETLIAGEVGEWVTRKPRKLITGDRVFIWESSPGKRLVGLAEVLVSEVREQGGDHYYSLRYLTDILANKPNIADLRKIHDLRGASFLKPGAALGILSLSLGEAIVLYERVNKLNKGLPDPWPGLRNVEYDLPDVDLDFFDSGFSVSEGRRMMATHLRRERNQEIVRLKKEEVLKTFGRLACEVCSFSFLERYGERGKGFCEAHHRLPLSEVTNYVDTRVEDLAIVCSNCHRMLHRRPGISVEELRLQLS